MKSLTHYLKECGDFASPMNTVGMGNVEPLSSDPIPTKTNIFKKKKNRRRKIIKRQ